jgi:hypothetical protein
MWPTQFGGMEIRAEGVADRSAQLLIALAVR